MEHLNLSIIDSADALEISLIPWKPNAGINLSVRDIHYFAIRRAPREEISLLDFTATTLLPSMPWPPELPDRFLPKELTPPPLLWLHADGAATFDLVAAVVVVLTQAH